MKKSWFFIVLILILFGFMVFCYSQGWLGAGSYSYAQKYQFNVNKTALIKSLEDLKKRNESLTFPMNYDSIDFHDDFGNFHIYFFSKKDNEITHAVVENVEDDNNKASVLLVGFSKGLSLGHWKEINRDFPRRENLARKKQFENDILGKLNLNYKNKGNSMWVFWK